MIPDKETQAHELGLGVFPQIWDLEMRKLSLSPLYMHPETKDFGGGEMSSFSQVRWSWAEIQKEDGKIIPGNFSVHNPVTFQESAKVYASVIRNSIWTGLRKNLAWTLVPLLPLISWEISDNDFRPLLCPYPSFISLVFCTLLEAWMGPTKRSQMFILTP